MKNKLLNFIKSLAKKGKLGQSATSLALMGSLLISPASITNISQNNDISGNNITTSISDNAEESEANSKSKDSDKLNYDSKSELAEKYSKYANNSLISEDLVQIINTIGLELIPDELKTLVEIKDNLVLNNVLDYYNFNREQLQSLITYSLEENDNLKSEIDVINNLYLLSQISNESKLNIIKDYFNLSEEELNETIDNNISISKLFGYNLSYENAVKNLYISALLPLNYKIQTICDTNKVDEGTLSEIINSLIASKNINESDNISYEDTIKNIYEETILPNEYKLKVLLKNNRINNLLEIIPYFLESKQYKEMGINSKENVINYLYLLFNTSLDYKLSKVLTYCNLSNDEFKKYAITLINENGEEESPEAVEKVINKLYMSSLLPIEYKRDEVFNKYNLNEESIKEVATYFDNNMTMEQIINHLYESGNTLTKYRINVVLNYCGLSKEEFQEFASWIINESEKSGNGSMTETEVINFMYENSLVPVEKKLKTISEQYNLSMEQVKTIVAIFNAEAKDGSYIDGYATANTGYNRIHSSAWINSFSTNLYKQATAQNQFIVYQSGAYYSKLGNYTSLDSLGIIDMLYSEVNMHSYLSFLSAENKRSNRIQFVAGGNNYFDTFTRTSTTTKPLTKEYTYQR